MPLPFFLSRAIGCLFIGLFPFFLIAQTPPDDSAFIAANFVKTEQRIPMRDGVKLFTAIYMPKDHSERFPFLITRTPYSCSPYGIAKMRSDLGPNPLLMHDKYIFVYQDVRGRYMSQGIFDEMTPLTSDANNHSTDEGTDTFDTIEWLLKNTPNNNGMVGIYGISYPGFYATAALPNAHPAIKAVSPQAPVTDEFIGDDAYHNGAFFLLDNFDFTNYFQGTRIDSGKNYQNAFMTNYTDAYRFFLELGSLKNTNSNLYFNHKAKIWDEYLLHDTYDDYWKKRNIRPHLKNIRPAVLVVGGWFDAEDIFGALRTFETIKKLSPTTNNKLVMGPWTHGAWSEEQWTHFGTNEFAENININYRLIETKFFDYYLKGKGDWDVPEATIYETGTNQWRHYRQWPPANSFPAKYYLGANSTLSINSPQNVNQFDQYVSNPLKPVPYTNGIFANRNSEYLTEDQRFISQRADVSFYTSDSLSHELNVTGRLKADIFMSSSGTDADIVVKLIDVFPDNAPNSKMSGFQQLIRAEVFRCKFRNSYEKPEPLLPDKPTEIKFYLNEIAHTFKTGHRLMVLIQSTWFPLVDLNPQQFLDIPTCNDTDFKKATIKIFRDAAHPSHIELPLIKE